MTCVRIYRCFVSNNHYDGHDRAVANEQYFLKITHGFKKPQNQPTTSVSLTKSTLKIREMPNCKMLSSFGISEV